MTNRGKCLLYKFYSFLIYSVPMVILFLVNIDAYRSDGSLFGFFGYLILALIFLCFKNSIIDLIKTRTLLSMSVILLIFSIVMQYIASEMVLIMAVSCVGSILQGAVEAVANVYEGYSYLVTDGVKKRNMAYAIPDRQAWREAYGLMGAQNEE